MEVQNNVNNAYIHIWSDSTLKYLHFIAFDNISKVSYRTKTSGRTRFCFIKLINNLHDEKRRLWKKERYNQLLSKSEMVNPRPVIKLAEIYRNFNNSIRFSRETRKVWESVAYQNNSDGITRFKSLLNTKVLVNN